MHLLGTGFFISTNGLFITAKHILLDPFGARGREKYPIGIVQFLPEGVFIQRPILRCASHTVADVAVGAAAPMNKNKTSGMLTNPILSLSTASVEVGTRIVTYAYPKHANVIDEESQQINLCPTFYDGFVEEFYPNGRDRVLLPGPCYQTSIVIHGGASGGPVFGPDGYVHGVNSTGFEEDELSFISLVKDVLELTIDDVSVEGRGPRSISIAELVRLGHVIVKRH